MAMDFRNAAGRVRARVAMKRPAELSKSALTPDALRDNIIAEEQAHSARFKGATRNIPRIEWEHENEDGTKSQKAYDWDTWPEMLRDVARASFGYDEPEILPPHAVRASARLNREILAETLISEGFQASRPYTRGNPLESLFNSLAQSKDLQESARTRLAEHIARSQQMGEQEQEIMDADTMMDQLRQQARDEIDNAGQVDDQTKRDIKGQVKRRQAAREQLEQLMHELGQSTMVADAAAAAQSAASAGEEAVQALRSLPGMGDGQAQNLTPDQQIALAEKWSENHNLKAIARMLGRMYRDMRFKRETRVKNVPIEPVGITTGNDLQRLLPTEQARALQKDAFSQFTFIRDFFGENLLEWEMSGNMPAGKGPIVCATDGSGSMGGEPFIWASSLALCLLTMAHREKRDFAGVEFGGSVLECKSWFFPKGVPIDANTVLDYASHFYGGGTSTVVGMTEACRIIEQVPEFSTADVVLIGDGQDYFREADQAIKARLEALGVRIHGISIRCPNNKYMEQMCSTVVDVIDLAGSNAATDAVAANIT